MSREFVSLRLQGSLEETGQWDIFTIWGFRKLLMCLDVKGQNWNQFCSLFYRAFSCNGGVGLLKDNLSVICETLKPCEILSQESPVVIPG